MTLALTLPRIKTTHSIYALLLVANIFMGAVVMEQSRVIDSQRVLIKGLFYDNVQMAATKFKRAVGRK